MSQDIDKLKKSIASLKKIMAPKNKPIPIRRPKKKGK
jgi:hypothetical protein